MTKITIKRGRYVLVEDDGTERYITKQEYTRFKKQMVKNRMLRGYKRVTPRIKRRETRMSALVMKATPTLYGEDARIVREEVLKTPGVQNLERKRALLEILDRVTK